MSNEGEVLEAHQYRRLWLDTSAELGLVAEELASALGWQPTPAEPLPNALELAQVAARRLHELERAVSVYQPKLKGRKEPVRELA